ncbi:MAG: VOC family protein [Ignavibacteriaceae bacterium]|nr:VOC family protein [Ignavibacteriaceae bacterium]
MNGNTKPEIGSLGWFDLTVQDAETVKNFYSKVIGLKPEPVSMGDYDDYNMNSPDSGRTVTGICHRKGVNSDLPSQWLIYFNVENIEESIKACTQNGGKVLVPPKDLGNYGKYCVIQDPAGAVCALFRQS